MHINNNQARNFETLPAGIKELSREKALDKYDILFFQKRSESFCGSVKKIPHDIVIVW